MSELSEKYGCHVYIKREDLQYVRSFKLRGAYYKIKVEKVAREKGIVCASAGNHAQGVAYACAQLGIDGKIFMPQTTPKQKINQVKMFGREHVEIILSGILLTTRPPVQRSMRMKMTGFSSIHSMTYDIIAGQGTVAIEIMNDIEEPIDYVFSSIGGGGLLSGLSTYIKNVSPNTHMIGVEPAGAASMQAAFANKGATTLNEIDKFVDGAAVQCVGQHTYEICRKYVTDIVPVPEGKVCSTILELVQFACDHC